MLLSMCCARRPPISFSVSRPHSQIEPFVDRNFFSSLLKFFTFFRPFPPLAVSSLFQLFTVLCWSSSPAAVDLAHLDRLNCVAEPVVLSWSASVLEFCNLSSAPTLGSNFFFVISHHFNKAVKSFIKMVAKSIKNDFVRLWLRKMSFL